MDNGIGYGGSDLELSAGHSRRIGDKDCGKNKINGCDDCYSKMGAIIKMWSLWELASYLNHRNIMDFLSK